jgi:tetratricopeptide (TPR) repeat protein
MKPENRDQRTEVRGLGSENVQRPTSNVQRSIQRLACHAVALCVGWVLVLDCPAQTIVLKSGQKIEALSVRRENDLVMAKIQVGTSVGEAGYQIPQIAKIEFPEPRGLKDASALLAQGEAAKALTDIDQVVKFYEPFKSIGGAWWAQAALIKISALTALHRENEVEALAADIQKSATDPDTARAVQLRLVTALIRKKDFEKAIAICDEAIKQSSDPTTLANAWLGKGDALLALKDADEALMAYLHVPVFYSNEKNVVPAAILGSARAYRRLDHIDLAKRSLNELIASFPKSGEAVAAQTELKKLQ